MSDKAMCHVCRKMSSRPGFVFLNPDNLEHCLLCNRPLCVRHKGSETESVCEIDYRSYHHNHRHLHGTGTIFRSMTHRNIEMDPSNAGLD
ncbi:hypothetical protein EAE96_006527 [Botrytis aclada]|nr:hypothetical protein EAE96_006527 [Botrytis aclada]